jgi:hypothetical protein
MIDRGSVLKGCWWAEPLIHRKQFLIWKILGGPRPSSVPNKLRQCPHGNYIRQVYSSNICDGRSSKSRSVLALTQLGSCSNDGMQDAAMQGGLSCSCTRARSGTTGIQRVADGLQPSAYKALPSAYDMPRAAVGV